MKYAQSMMYHTISNQQQIRTYKIIASSVHVTKIYKCALVHRYSDIKITLNIKNRWHS